MLSFSRQLDTTSNHLRRESYKNTVCLVFKTFIRVQICFDSFTLTPSVASLWSTLCPFGPHGLLLLVTHCVYAAQIVSGGGPRGSHAHKGTASPFPSVPHVAVAPH